MSGDDGFEDAAERKANKRSDSILHNALHTGVPLQFSLESFFGFATVVGFDDWSITLRLWEGRTKDTEGKLTTVVSRRTINWFNDKATNDKPAVVKDARVIKV